MNIRVEQIELVCFDEQGNQLNCRATVIDAEQCLAELLWSPETEGLARGDAVKYERRADFAFPVITAKVSIQCVQAYDGLIPFPLCRSK